MRVNFVCSAYSSPLQDSFKIFKKPPKKGRRKEVIEMIKQSEWPEQIVKYVTSQATFDETSGDQQTLAIFSTVLDLIDYN